MCNQIEKSCYNQNESTKSKIRNALGLKENECIIDGSDRGTYTIKPIVDGKELQINTIKSVDTNGSRIPLLQFCNIVFEHCIFACEIRLEGTGDEIEPPTDKKISKFDRISPIDKRTDFIKCTFKKLVSFKQLSLEKGIVFQDIVFKSVASFDVVTFKSQAEFSNCIFQNEANFSNSTFSQKANFTQTIFKASAYFDKATFEGGVTFERSEFCENAHFYQTKFSENPDFFQTMFNEHLNLTDAKICNESSNSTDTPIFNFDFEVLREEVQTCSEADKYRDIFKNIKNALIKSGNLLGASRFRKMELYCKEIELDLKKKENRETSIRDFVDRIQLYCYRTTSDHHTDLMLILNNVIILIACFGIVCFCLMFYYKGYAYFTISETCGALGTLAICFLFMAIALCSILKCCKDISLSSLKACGVFAISYSQHNCLRMCILSFFYLIVMLILAIKPALILPIFGKLIDESLKIDFPAFTSLSVVYAILMFLLIWSLQKTARKNTIVPN